MNNLDEMIKKLDNMIVLLSDISKHLGIIENTLENHLDEIKKGIND